MAAKLRYRIQPVGAELAEASPAQPDEGRQGGRPVYRLLEDLWRKVMTTGAADGQQEIVAIECEEGERPATEVNGHIVRRRQFESWAEMREMADRMYEGRLSLLDRERFGWTMPATASGHEYPRLDPEISRRRTARPVPLESIEPEENDAFDCCVCGRSHSRRGGCPKAVLDAIDRTMAMDRDPPPIDSGRSFNHRLADAELIRSLCDDDKVATRRYVYRSYYKVPRDFRRGRSTAKFDCLVCGYRHSRTKRCGRPVECTSEGIAAILGRSFVPAVAAP